MSEPLRDRLDREIKFALAGNELLRRLVTEDELVSAAPQDWNRMLLTYIRALHHALLELAERVDRLKAE